MFEHQRHRRRLVARIITDRPQQIANCVLDEMKRGATPIEGKGIYTGNPHHTLLIALTITETPHLKSIIQRGDPAALKIVSPAQEVLGRGFQKSQI